MALNAPAASARPDIISLDILLSDVDEGRVRIPRFQRPYVWTPQMMRELFESVLKGYPIGSLLFWTPRNLDVETMDHIGPIPAMRAASSLPTSLVLDGHQRLATLYGVLRLPETHPRGQDASASDAAWWLGYDLATEQTKQMRRPEDFINPTILPLRSVLRTADFVRFAKLIDASSALTSEQKIAYLDRADDVQRSVRDYRIALTSMRDGNVDDAVAIFSRVNRSGRRITSDQMAVALTYREGFNLEDALDEILGSLSTYGFGDVSRQIVLQSLLRAAGRNFTKPNFDDLREPDTQRALELAVQPVKIALSDGAAFLNNAIGFRTGRLLPYALQLLLLSVYFLKRPMNNFGISAEESYRLERWFWGTSFEGWFASANSSEVAKAANVMESFAVDHNQPETLKTFEAYFLDRPLRPFPKTFDRRSARIRCLLLTQIVSGELLDPITGESIDGSLLMADADTRDLPYIFPPGGTKAGKSPANRILLPRTHGSIVRSVLEQHLNESKALRSHSINRVAGDAIASRDLDAFVVARESEIRASEQALLKQFALSVDTSAVQSDLEIDVEE